MRKIVAFYAWQSDTPEKFNRHLIRIALEEAAKRITADPTIDAQLIVDYDTEGVPGTPPISQTILNKIEACDIFIPDVSFVARTEAGKFVPNPNVMTEYGYALRAKSHAAMMPIMNTAFGPPEELPFDMGHLRFPVQYHVEADAADGQRRAVRRALSQQLEEKLRLQETATRPAPPAPRPFAEAAPAADNPALYFDPVQVLGNAGYPGEQEFHFPYDGRAAYIRLFPTYQSIRVGLARLVPVFEARNPCPMTMVVGGIPLRNRFGPIILDPRGPHTILGLTQGFETGELWGVTEAVFANHRLGQVPVWAIPTITFEKLYVRVLDNYVKVMGVLQQPPPYTVEMGIIGMQDTYFTIPGVHQRGEFKGPILQNVFKGRYSLDGVTNNDVKNVLRTFFEELYDLAAFRRSDAFNDHTVVAHDLPSR
jgi:hypothetical protein